MPPESDKVVALRRLLSERFPAQAARERRIVPTGVPALDELLGGGLLTGGITEFVSAVPSGSNQLSLGSILLSTRMARQRVALVDAAGTFDWEGWDDDAVAHLVWIRARTLAESWRAADLVARDPNYVVVVLDLRGFPERELLRSKDSIWVRLQRATETADTALVVQTTTPVAPSAAMRVIFREPLSGKTLTEPRIELLQQVAPELQRARQRRNLA